MYLIVVVNEEVQSNSAHDATNPGLRERAGTKSLMSLVGATDLGPIKQVAGFLTHTCRLLSIHWPVGRDAINGRAPVFMGPGKAGCKSTEGVAAFAIVLKVSSLSWSIEALCDRRSLWCVL